MLIDKGMEYTLGLGKYFKERFTELGGRSFWRILTRPATKTSAQVTKLKAPSMPDILYISSGPDEIGTIVKQFRDAGVEKPIVGGDGYDTPLLVQIAGKGAENVYFSTHSLMDPTRAPMP